MRKALDENFGGEDENPPVAPGFGTAPAFKFTKYSNAYMLVYIRASDWDQARPRPPGRPPRSALRPGPAHAMWDTGTGAHGLDFLYSWAPRRLGSAGHNQQPSRIREQGVRVAHICRVACEQGAGRSPSSKRCKSDRLAGRERR